MNMPSAHSTPGTLRVLKIVWREITGAITTAGVCFAITQRSTFAFRIIPDVELRDPTSNPIWAMLKNTDVAIAVNIARNGRCPIIATANRTLIICRMTRRPHRSAHGPSGMPQLITRLAFCRRFPAAIYRLAAPSQPPGAS